MSFLKVFGHYHLHLENQFEKENQSERDFSSFPLNLYHSFGDRMLRR